ncbi:hypothetical protein EWM64_g1228 [Hericium alpestre]|uniref:DNA repair protein rhp7 treble clef domain-containing protein n=1 Tax=Hericium alpestre TaxID=135208 RepID=A0A4Z0A7Q9_9AGAM|nr:hypothetical protein EWM64_g1228 [Hericium alpestre]
MSGNNVRGPTSALTEFLRESGITATTIARRGRNANRTEQQNEEPGAGPSNSNEDESNEAGGSTRRAIDTAGYASDNLDEEDTESQPKKRRVNKADSAKQKRGKGKKAKKDDDEDYEDEDEDAYTALSKSMWTNVGSSSSKPPVGSFETCARCEAQFTVTKYTMAAVPPPGFLCHKCAKASGADPFKKPVVPRKRKPAVGRRNVVSFEDRKFPSLVSLCVQLISKHINDVEAFGDIGAANLDRIIRALCRNRSLTPENVKLFYGAGNTELTFYDATTLIPDSLCSLAYLNPNLTSLRIDFCGRINNDVVKTWSTALPALTRLELLGPYLVRPPAWIQFFETHPQLQGLTDLRLKEIGKLDDSFLDHIKTMAKLTYLDLSDPAESLSEEGLIALLSVIGPNLTEIDLSNHKLLSDDFLKEGLQPHMARIRSLVLNGLPLLTDAGGAALFEACDNEKMVLNSLSSLVVKSSATLPSTPSYSMQVVCSRS